MKQIVSVHNYWLATSSLLFRTEVRVGKNTNRPLPRRKSSTTKIRGFVITTGCISEAGKSRSRPIDYRNSTYLTVSRGFWSNSVDKTNFLYLLIKEVKRDITATFFFFNSFVNFYNIIFTSFSGGFEDIARTTELFHQSPPTGRSRTGSLHLNDSSWLGPTCLRGHGRRGNSLWGHTENFIPVEDDTRGSRLLQSESGDPTSSYLVSTPSTLSSPLLSKTLLCSVVLEPLAFLETLRSFV